MPSLLGQNLHGLTQVFDIPHKVTCIRRFPSFGCQRENWNTKNLCHIGPNWSKLAWDGEKLTIFHITYVTCISRLSCFGYQWKQLKIFIWWPMSSVKIETQISHHILDILQTNSGSDPPLTKILPIGRLQKFILILRVDRCEVVIKNVKMSNSFGADRVISPALLPLSPNLRSERSVAKITLEMPVPGSLSAGNVHVYLHLSSNGLQNLPDTFFALRNSWIWSEKSLLLGPFALHARYTLSSMCEKASKIKMSLL